MVKRNYRLKFPEVHTNSKVELRIVPFAHDALVGVGPVSGGMRIQAVKPEAVIQSKHTEHRQEDAYTDTGCALHVERVETAHAGVRISTFGKRQHEEGRLWIEWDRIA